MSDSETKKRSSFHIQPHPLAHISLRPSHCFHLSSDSTTTSRFFVKACLPLQNGTLFGFLQGFLPLSFLPSSLHYPLGALLLASSSVCQWFKCAVGSTCPKRNYIISHAKWAASLGDGWHLPYIKKKITYWLPVSQSKPGISSP